MTAKNIREIFVTDTFTVKEKGHVVMTVNGEPVYSTPESISPISEEELLRLAIFVTDDLDVAQAWMDRPNPGLKNLTPRQAVEAGCGQDAANILRSFVAL